MALAEEDVTMVVNVYLYLLLVFFHCRVIRSNQIFTGFMTECGLSKGNRKRENLWSIKTFIDLKLSSGNKWAVFTLPIVTVQTLKLALKPHSSVLNCRLVLGWISRRQSSLKTDRWEPPAIGVQPVFEFSQWSSIIGKSCGFESLWKPLPLTGWW